MITLGEFNQKFIAPNTIIRLWVDHGIGYASITRPFMNWELDKEGSEHYCYRDFEMVCVTGDIITDGLESINIVIGKDDIV